MFNYVSLKETLKQIVMTDSNYVKVFTGNLIITERIIQSLENLDINAVVKEQNESSLNPIFGGHLLQEIYVHKDELDEAAKVVQNITSELEA